MAVSSKSAPHWTYVDVPVLLPNNTSVVARNAADSADVPMFKLNTSNQLQITPTTKIVSGAGVINLIIADNETDATGKIARVGNSHYTNSEEPVALITGNMTVGTNQVSVGGGVGQMNAATDIVLYAASNTTTLTGTERLRISGNGLITVADAVNIVVGTTTGTKLGTATTQKMAFWNATPRIQPSGWTTVPTGTLTRTTFVTSTVTLPQLAERVAALIVDLHAAAGVGLIGA
jgi:hypothetical protein